MNINPFELNLNKAPNRDHLFNANKREGWASEDLTVWNQACKVWVEFNKQTNQAEICSVQN